MLPLFVTHTQMLRRRLTKTEKIVAQRFVVARRAYDLAHRRYTVARNAEQEILLLMAVLEPLLLLNSEAGMMGVEECMRRQGATNLALKERDEAQKRFEDETRAGVRLGIVKV